jgi:hypothetical protein
MNILLVNAEIKTGLKTEKFAIENLKAAWEVF